LIGNSAVGLLHQQVVQVQSVTGHIEISMARIEQGAVDLAAELVGGGQ
jgi:hypothetical protein